MLAKLFITPQKQTLSPPDKAILAALEHLGYSNATKVSFGRYLDLELDDTIPAESLQEMVTKICTDPRVNLVSPIMEDWRAEVTLPNGEILHIVQEKRKKK